jgi:hypothetical protein
MGIRSWSGNPAFQHARAHVLAIDGVVVVHCADERLSGKSRLPLQDLARMSGGCSAVAELRRRRRRVVGAVSLL